MASSSAASLLLGHRNVESRTTSLSNPKGVALALKAKADRPALSVNTRSQVANLNAELLGGHPAGDFLPTTGTAADSAKVGGHPAGDFLPAAGTAANSTKLNGADSSTYLNHVWSAQTNAIEGTTPTLDDGIHFDHIDLPAGTYNLAFTASLYNSSTSSWGTVACYLLRLREGKGPDEAGYAFGTYSSDFSGGAGNVAVNSVLTLPTATGLEVSCSTLAPGAKKGAVVFSSSLTATRIDVLNGKPVG